MFKLLKVLVLIDFFIASSPQMVDLLTSTNNNFEPVSRISRDGETFSGKILDLKENFGIQEEIFTDLERVKSYILI